MIWFPECEGLTQFMELVTVMEAFCSRSGCVLALVALTEMIFEGIGLDCTGELAFTLHEWLLGAWPCAA
jgi:hypothetical protein